MIALWDRKLSDEEVAALKKDPYCFLKPLPKVYFWTKAWNEFTWWLQLRLSKEEEI